MKKMSYVKKSIITAACIALCVVLPMVFHSIPDSGSVLCPMHIPVLLCGLICGWPFGLLCGIAGPFLSSMLTQMPPAAYLPTMMVELAVYGLISGGMMQVISTGKLYGDLYISLIGSMRVGRVAAGIVKALIFTAGEYSVAVWAVSYFVTAWPGIVIQLVLIPAIVTALERAKLIPRRYPKR